MLTKTPRFFVRMRSVIAPYVRPLLEHVWPIRAIALWVLAKRHRSTIEQGGHLYEIDPKDFGVTFELESTGDYEQKTRELCLEHLKPGMTFVDVGAHIGLFAIPAAKAVGPAGRVYAFDPDPDNFRLLSRNVQASGYTNLELLQMAVSNVNGTLTLHRSSYNTGDHRLFYQGRRRSTVAVKSVTLDQYFDGTTQAIDIVKFDIQGAEAAALQGMAGILAKCGGIRLFIEFAPSMLRDAGADPLEFLEALEGQRFVLSVIDEALGTVTAADARTIMRNSRDRAYCNIMCHRQSASS